MKKIKNELAYRLINHGPLLVVSASYEKKETFTPIAWNMPVEHTPPLIAITVSKENFINKLIKKSREFSLNILDACFIPQIIKFGSVSGADKDKIKESKLSTKKCAKIKCRYIKESTAVIECILKKIINIGDVDIFIGEAVFCRASDAFSAGVWDIKKIRTVHHLGGGKFSTDAEIKP